MGKRGYRIQSGVVFRVEKRHGATRFCCAARSVDVFCYVAVFVGVPRISGMYYCFRFY